MANPAIIILHKLPGRIRVKLSHPLKNPEEAEKIIKEHYSIVSFKYNTVTKSLLIKFDKFKIQVEEVLIRIAIVYSKNYGFTPVKLISNYVKREMPILSYYSMLSILAAAVSKVIPATKSIQDFLNWLAVGTTVGAIGEHAYSEINEKGTVDPEVMSVMYLISSIRKGEFITPSIITWIATFGRHIVNTSYEGLIFKINEVNDVYTQQNCYDVSVLPAQDNRKKMSFLKTFISEIIENQSSTIGKSLLVTKQGINHMQGKLECGTLRSCSRITLNNRDKNIICSAIN